MTDQKREEQAEAATTFLTELLKGKDGVTRVEEEAEKLEVGRAFLRACVGDRAVAVREMWQIKSALGRLGGLMWAAVDPESLRNSGLGGIGPNSIHEVATAAHGVLQLGGADSGGGLSDDGSKWSFFRPFFSSAALLKPPPGERRASKEGSIPSSSHHITCGPAPRAISFTVSEIHDITV